jgi:hypothetical protein
MCGGCGRELKSGPRCVYCGWSKDAALAAALDAGILYEDTFRSGATLSPFLMLAALVTFFCVSVGWAVWKADSDHTVAVLVFLAAALFGGVTPLVVQFIRRNLIWVRLVPSRGLEFPRREVVPWQDIASVDLVLGAAAGQPSMEELTWGLWGCIFFPILGFYKLLFKLVSISFRPTSGVFSTWYSRATISLKSGEHIMLRDLDDAERFVRMSRAGMQQPQP